MIAVDTSVIVDYLQGVSSSYTHMLQKKITANEAAIAAVVITELLSNPEPPPLLNAFLEEVDPLAIEEGYWERAGKNRARLKAKGLKARTADALIAQSCIDHRMPLLTRDRDFTYFAKFCGLELALPGERRALAAC